VVASETAHHRRVGVSSRQGTGFSPQCGVRSAEELLPIKELLGNFVQYEYYQVQTQRTDGLQFREMT
jgi:hypothetical protein